MTILFRFVYIHLFITLLSLVYSFLYSNSLSLSILLIPFLHQHSFEFPTVVLRLTFRQRRGKETTQRIRFRFCTPLPKHLLDSIPSFTTDPPCITHQNLFHLPPSFLLSLLYVLRYVHIYKHTSHVLLTPVHPISYEIWRVIGWKVIKKSFSLRNFSFFYFFFLFFFIFFIIIY